MVVEGYTDVMACHLAGITTAVATCGTAFGTEHIKVARRLLSDDGTGGEVVFCFDGDAAGQKAALRAFEEDQRFTAQTYVAVEPTGADPCDLRQTRGDAAVRDLISSRRPLFEFAIRASLKRHNLDTVEGRVAALREAAPVVAQIRDAGIRPAYARELAGWLGMSVEEVNRAVAVAMKRASAGPQGGAGTGCGTAGRPGCRKARRSRRARRCCRTGVGRRPVLSPAGPAGPCGLHGAPGAGGGAAGTGACSPGRSGTASPPPGSPPRPSRRSMTPCAPPGRA